MSDLDAIDRSILRILQQDGRITNADLATKVGLSPSACSRRVDILEKSGTIAGYHARIAHKALDYKIMVIVHISLSGQFAKTLAEFEAAVKLCPNVLVCYLMSGNTTTSCGWRRRTSRTTNGSTAIGCRRCRMW